MMETKKYYFHTSFYIPVIQKLAFRLPYVHILGTNHCGEMRHIAFKRHELFQDFLCCCDYAERVVAIFNDQIKPEYYGGNRSVSIEGIVLVNFSALPKADIKSSTISDIVVSFITISFLVYIFVDSFDEDSCSHM